MFYFLCFYAASFHEIMKTEMCIAKLVDKLDKDRDEDVRAAAARALAALGTKGLLCSFIRSSLPSCFVSSFQIRSRRG
jgi:hypothetical protein